MLLGANRKMLLLQNLFELLAANAVFFVTVFGIGLFIESILTPERARSFFPLQLIAFGISGLALVEGVLGLSGINERWLNTSLFLASAGCLLWCFRMPSLDWVRTRLLSDWPSLLLWAIWLPIFLRSELTAITDWDGLYNWDTWSRHWGLRETMDKYSFGFYTQLFPIVFGYVYKIMGTGGDVLPMTQFANHGSYAFLGGFALVGFYRMLVRLLGDHLKLLGLTISLLLFTQNDIWHGFLNFKAEGMLIVLGVAALDRFTGSVRIEFSWREFFSLCLIGAGLGFAKLSGLELGLVLVCLYSLLAGVNRKGLEGLGEVKGLPKRLFRVIVGILLCASIAAAFLGLNKRYWNDEGYVFPTNHSQWVDFDAVRSLTAGAHASMMTSYPWIKSEWGIFSNLFLLLFSQHTLLTAPFPFHTYVFAAVFIFGVLFELGGMELWSLGLFLGGVVGYYHWWKVLSYANYNLAVFIPLFFLLFALGLGRALDLLRTSFVGLRKFVSYGIVGLFVSAVFFAARVSSFAHLKPVGKLLASKELPILQTDIQRLDSAYEGKGKGIESVLSLLKPQLEPHNWRKLIVAADLPWNRYLPNSFHRQFVFSNAGFVAYPTYYEKARYGLLTEVSNSGFSGAMDVGGGVYVRPGRGFFTTRPDFIRVPRVESPSFGRGLMFLVEDRSCSDEVEGVFGAPVVSNGSWQVSGSALAKKRHAAFEAPLFSKAVLEGSPATWISNLSVAGADGQLNIFSKRIFVPRPKRARILVSAHNTGVLFQNGIKLGEIRAWNFQERFETEVRSGDLFEVEVNTLRGGHPALLFQMDWIDPAADAGQAQIRYLGNLTPEKCLKLHYLYLEPQNGSGSRRNLELSQFRSLNERLVSIGTLEMPMSGQTSAFVPN